MYLLKVVSVVINSKRLVLFFLKFQNRIQGSCLLSLPFPFSEWMDGYALWYYFLYQELFILMVLFSSKFYNIAILKGAACYLISRKAAGQI